MSIKSKEDFQNKLAKIDVKELKIAPGNIIEVKLQDPQNKKDDSVAYFEIRKKKDSEELYLKSFNSEAFHSNGYQEQFLNSSNLDLQNAKVLLDKELLHASLAAKFKALNPNLGAEEWYNFNPKNINLQIKDVTKDVLKEKKENEKLEEQKIETAQKEVLLDVPSDILEYAEKKNKTVTKESYTKNIFKMLKTLSQIPYYNQNISDEDKKFLKPLLDKFNQKDTEEHKQNVFNQYIFDNKNKNSEDIERLGIIYKKNVLNEHFKGFEKKRTPHVQYEMDENLRAVAENKYPIMNYQENVSHIANPITNELYKGNNAIALQRSNLMNGIDENFYIPINQVYKNGGIINPNYRMKAQIIALGKNNVGQNMYAYVVPAKSCYKATKKMRKEELRRAIFDAKFNYKYGELPTFETEVVKTQRLPVQNAQNIIPPTMEPNMSFEQHVAYDTAMYHYASLTQTPYTPSLPYTKEPYKQQLYNMIANHPEETIKMNNKEYVKIAEQTKIKERSNENVNTNVNTLENVLENENTKSHGRRK